MDFPKEPEVVRNNFRRVEYLATTPGAHVIRLVSDIHTERTHFVRNTTIACVGDDCPICANNKKIIMENPSSFRNVAGYSYPRLTRYVNALDRTLAKICPNVDCGAEIKATIDGNFLPTCPKCGTMIVSVVPAELNKVKVFSRGKELFDQLELIQTSKRDRNNNVIGIENFDIELVVGQNKQPVPSARLDRMDVVTVNPDDLFDLTAVVIRLTAEEIPDFLKGISFKDIFSSRRLNAPAIVESSGVSEELEADLDAAISNLFG